MGFGEFEKAGEMFRQSLEILSRTRGPTVPGVAVCHLNLGRYHQARGRFKDAEVHYRRSLVILEGHTDRRPTMVTKPLKYLGELCLILGEYTRAQSLLTRALTILTDKMGREHHAVGSLLFCLGKLYRSLGDLEAAESYFLQSLQTLEKALGTGHPKTAGALLHLGTFYRTKGAYEAAERLITRSIRIQEEYREPGHPKLRRSHNQLADVYLVSGRTDDALAIYAQQRSRSGIGLCRMAQHDYAGAAEAFGRVLRKGERKGIDNKVILAHIGLGLAWEGRRNFSAAKLHLREAIGIIEGQWSTLTLAGRENFLLAEVGPGITRLTAYEGLVRVLFEEHESGYEAEALAVAEMVKSRTFLEMLAVRGVVVSRAEDQRILEQDRLFQRKISALRERLSALKELGAAAPPGRRRDTRKALARAAAAYEGFIKRVKIDATEVASLISPESVSADDIRGLLDERTTVLEFYITRQQVFAWVLGRRQTKAYRLAVTAREVTALVNDLLLPNISRVSRRPAPLIVFDAAADRVEAHSETERQQNRKRFHELTEDLYRELVAPLAADIDTPNLVIVPHGPLHKVPFAALSDGSRYLGERFAIARVPSAAILKFVLRKRNKDEGRFMALANPATAYPSLDFAEMEVQRVSRHFKDKRVYFRQEATEAVAKTGCREPDVVHFASHGEFNDRQPLQSGLLLARDGANDGFLQVHETFGLDLENANLVVMSACETALSKIRGGDDLVGLSRGFIYAGAPALLATLWQVEDRSTALLMEQFYENWREKKMTKAAALQQARQAIRRMPQYRHPFFWAPFILIGDWT